MLPAWAVCALAAVLCLSVIQGCGAEPPTLPRSSPFPADLQLGMTLGDLLRIRSGAVVRDGGEVEEPYFDGWLRYGFESGPERSRHRRLTHVERTEPFLDKAGARARWRELVGRFSAEFGVGLWCADRIHGEVHWRRAGTGTPGLPVAFVVDVQEFDETSRSRHPAVVVTRVWRADLAPSQSELDGEPGDSVLAGRPIPCEADWEVDSAISSDETPSRRPTRDVGPGYRRLTFAPMLAILHQ